MKAKKINGWQKPQGAPVRLIRSYTKPQNCPYQLLIPRPVAFAMYWFVYKNSPRECAWRGLVERQGNNFLFFEIFFPEQEVTNSTVHITPEGEALIMQELAAAGRLHDIAKIKLWGHSHPNFSTSPSGTDEEQTQEFLERTDGFFVRMIVNTKKEMHLTIYVHEEDGLLTIEQPPVQIIGPSLTQEEKRTVYEQVKNGCERVKSQRIFFGLFSGRYARTPLGRDTRKQSKKRRQRLVPVPLGHRNTKPRN